MNLDEWHPRSEYFKARRLRAYWWARDRHGKLEPHDCFGNGRGREAVLEGMEGRAERQKETSLQVRGGVGEMAAQVRQVYPGGQAGVESRLHAGIHAEI
jgi:hypothetical protein